MAQILFTAVAGAATKAAGIGGLAAALIGTAAGVAGKAVDSALFGKKTFRQVEGPRLESLSVLSSTEGAPIRRLYGRTIVSGELIWATRFREEIITTTETVKTGKGGGGGSSSTVESTEYNYSISFAVGLAEGEILAVNRAWADGKEFDLRDVTYRVYKGTETQNPDSFIESKEGSGNVPAYRGLAYIVFENLPVDKFGRRIPQLKFEIIKPIKNAVAEGLVQGVNLIPGATEFGYDTTIIQQSYGTAQFDNVERRVENEHLLRGVSDLTASLDSLDGTCPDLKSVCLVVTWFGDDLRAGDCTIRPKVENTTKETTPVSWAVAGLTRATALVISQVNGSAAFGGTPNDDSVKRCIAALKAKGWKVMFYPFIMMDIPSGNSLPNPYSDNASETGQAVYPWRGRITVSPAAGFDGTVDKTATAASQISSFYNGSWGYKNFIEHYADLCAAAGGVDYFCIGSEMIGLTQARSDANTYPFVETHLTALAASVSSKLPSAEIGYAADWSEYHSHRPSDGSGDVYFNLDPLWADANIDFIGIDNYMPLSDWRDDAGHLDGAISPSIYDLDYLKSNIEGGEIYDFFYASDADRDAQTRTDITDGAGKPWVFRNKDIKNWWLNQHFNRPGGSESMSATSWTPESKPIYFTELGCPAIDKGANQPNVFVDPKSSESAFPYYSSGGRDDVIQRQFIRAHYEYWSDNDNNPASGVYSGRMIDTENIYIWAWDARPVPIFPYDHGAFSDGPNWETGHWISNRFGTVSMEDFLVELALDYPLTGYTDFQRAYGSADGFVIDRVMSFREATSELQLIFFFDFYDSSGKIRTRSKYEMERVATLTDDTVLAGGENEDAVQITRAQPIDLPALAGFRFLNADSDLKSGLVQRRHPTIPEVRHSFSAVPVALDMSRAQQAIDRWFYSRRAEREESAFGALPSQLAVEAGDVIGIPFADETRDLRIQRVREGDARRMTALSFDRAAFVSGAGGGRTSPLTPDLIAASPAVLLMDLPMLQDSDIEYAAYAAGYANPWAGVSINRSLTDSNYQLNTVLTGPAIIGFTRFDFFSMAPGRWDFGNDLYVEILGGELSSASEEDVLGGANACAVENADGGWEILQFVTATLEATLQYKLSQLLRGQRGSEDQVRDPVAAGARVVFFNLAVRQLNMLSNDLGIPYFYKYGPSNRQISSDLYQTEQLTLNGRGRKPYAPAHVRGLRDPGTNDITFSWIRRTRIDGEADWQDGVADVPLGEDSEQYEVDIMNGATVVRTLSVTTQSAVYTSAQETTDFGSQQGSHSIRVRQMSSSAGAGVNAEETITL